MVPLSARTYETLRGLRRITPKLSNETMSRYVASSPLYAGVDLPDHLFRDSAHSIRVMIDVALRLAGGEQADLPATMADVLERSGERAAEGLPVRDYLRCWQVAAAVLDEAVRQRIPDSDPDLTRVLSSLRGVHDEVIRDSAAAYIQYATALAAANTDRDSEVIDRLFAGQPTVSEAAEAPSRPIVAIADIGACAAEASALDSEARVLAARRKVRRLRGYIAREMPAVCLMDIRTDTARLIAHPTGFDWDQKAAELERVADGPVVLAFVAAETVADIPRAATVAGDVLRTAIRIGRQAGAVSINEVALSLHLTHPSSGLPTLLTKCAPLLVRAELVETIRTYLGNAMDRRITADVLGVHPNTVDNRLARINALTGLDVHRAADLITVAIAVDPALGWSETPAN
ncbi:helix-turn-helix domain-containing protein [Rhodococcus erythropolis]|uniref:PucR family transcriptional regulator n=1 Tax=Rhodococcus erythropolis TaxID=1833 RepID=UPI0030132DCD